MFHKIFSRKRSSLTLKSSRSVKTVSLYGKIVFGYCGGHDTIIIFVYIDGYKERTIRLCGTEACVWQKV